jgi:rhomboid protease GluP
MNCMKYKPTYILIAINIIVYIYGAIVSNNALITGGVFTIQWGQVNALVLFEGASYQLFTAMFVHASIYHLAGNMLFLLIFGLRAEEMFSLPEYLGIYLAGGFVGDALSLVFGPGSLPYNPFISVGASGAIFALFGACVIYTRRSVGQSILGALVYAFFLLFITYGENVNILAHFGGLGFGLLAGYLIASTRKPYEERQFRYRNSPMPF